MDFYQVESKGQTIRQNLKEVKDYSPLKTEWIDRTPTVISVKYKWQRNLGNGPFVEEFIVSNYYMN